MFVTWPQPRCCCTAPGRGPPRLPHSQGQTLCPRLGGLGGGGCTHPRVAVEVQEGALASTLCIPLGGAGRWGVLTVPYAPRMPRFPPAGPAGYGAIRALPGGGRRSPHHPHPRSAPRVGDPVALRSPPRPALARRSLAVSRLPPLPAPPQTQNPLSQTNADEGWRWGEWGGEQTPHSMSPTTPGTDPPFPPFLGAAFVYVKNFPFLKRAMSAGVGRCLPPPRWLNLGRLEGGATAVGPTERRGLLPARGAADPTRRGCHQLWGGVGTALPSTVPARGAPSPRWGGLQGLSGPGTSGSGCWGLRSAGTSPIARLWGRRSPEQWQLGSSFSSRDPWSGARRHLLGHSRRCPAPVRGRGAALLEARIVGVRDGGQDSSLGTVGWHREVPRCLASGSTVLFCPVPAPRSPRIQRGTARSWPGSAG